ncbi:hypothetical protein BDQ17DRAFT_1433538 [Cyathus striatus]|nr:hypothetical protein BDQ17DRAFT_1433538 [Cyathus striatus]
MSFQNAHDFTMPIYGSLNQIDNSHNYINHSGNSALKSLIEAACLQAGHEAVERVDRPKCHPDTRLAVTDDIMNWVNSSNPKERILWMKGPAGAGKSSVAQTIAQRCKNEGKLISSFFFSRTAGNARDDGRRLVPTIAYYLMLAVPPVRELIVTELERDPGMFEYTPMEIQFQKLIVGPLSKVMADSPTTIPGIPNILIIDGLDECSD